ncbi:MAG: FAD-dependent oxidoreductase [Solirubrobacterales bacterium]|nr:FAD-dependent oxidoreductase [Solirubrobacterales bacterium]
MARDTDVEVAVIGAGVVGCAVALALARRQATVALLEAEPEPALAASGTNSGILHTGFDSAPGELETDLILASSALRVPVLRALEIPVLHCGALLRPLDPSQRAAVAAVAPRARQNGVDVVEHEDGALEFPGEAVTDPVVYTLALAAEAERHGAEVYTRCRVDSIERDGTGLRLQSGSGVTVRSRVAVNCAGLEADSVARLAGEESFSIYPRKGEFLVFDPPAGEPLPRILLPVPTKRTRGVLLFPTIDGRIVAGPTAVDLEDKRDWSVREQAREEIMLKAAALYPPLAGAEPVFAYAGLRPAGRCVNYVIRPAESCPQLVHVAAIRSTGLTASLGIAQRVAEIVRSLGVPLGDERPFIGGPIRVSAHPWWRRTADYRAAVTA